MARKRGNGRGTLYKRTDSGPWYASWYAPTPDGKGRERVERSTRTTSKSDADRMLRKWSEHAAMVSEGLAAPEGGTELDRHGAATIESHVESFKSAKHAEGRTNRHVDESAALILDTAKGCGWKLLREMSAEDLERYVGRKRAPVPEREGEPTPRAWKPRTAHKCITALRTFARWCVADGRLAADPLARVKKPAPTRQRSRRMLLVDEWRWLRDATEHGPERMGMNGHARRLLYELAIQTGLRSGELRALNRSCLNLNAERPFVLLDANHTKNRKAARQYVRPDLAESLGAFVARLMPGAPLFAMPRREHVAEMLRLDLEAARAKWIDESADDPEEHARRVGSDFLRATDHDKRVLDFHALRHTCGAWAAIGGASPKAVQTLMRHSSIVLTLDTYGHLLPDEAAETVARMPMPQAARMQLTGTDDRAQVPKTLPAVGPATAGRIVATQRDFARDWENENGPGEAPRPFLKRGGRDSNPQPPDRQSGTLTN